MEKKKNGCFKAVSVISLVIAIIYSVVLAFILISAIVDFQALVESFEIVALEETGGVPESSEDVLLVGARTAAIITLVAFSIMFAGMITVYFLTFTKMKKYSCLTNEEAHIYSGRLIAWIIVFFVFGDIVNAVLLLCGYFNVTKPQIDEYRRAFDAQYSIDEVPQTNDEKIDESVDLDLMITRLEKLNKIKEMGGLSDEEYESLRKSIVEGKK